MKDGSTVAVRDPSTGYGEPARERLRRMFAVHHVTVWRVLHLRGLSAADAADFTQQAFLVCAERLADVEPKSERAFLVATALKVARAMFRKARRLELDNDLIERVSTEADDQADLELCELALAKLAPELAEVFLLYEIEGFSSAELAALLEIPPGSVASRLRRAREQFRAAVTRLEQKTFRGGAT